MTQVAAKDRLIVALDVDTRKEALQIVDELGDTISFYKIGWQVFIRESYPLIAELIGRHKKIFLDLKMDDIEETIRSALANFPNESIEFLTIHGNGATANAARNGRGNKPKPKLLSVTYLSSLDETDLKDILGISQINLDEYILKRARSALDTGIEGLIASGKSVQAIRETISGDYFIVSPGIRPAGSPTDDHKRTLTPFEAIMAGSDYLVVGRPITNADNIKEAATAIIHDMQSALDQKHAAAVT